MPEPTIFDDEDFQDVLVTLLCRDMQSLLTSGGTISADDFSPFDGMKYGHQRYVVAQVALEHYTKYHEPVGRLLKVSVMEYCKSIGLDGARSKDLLAFTDRIAKIRPSNPDAVISKVLTFKREVIRASISDELTELIATNQLTDAKWHELFQRGAVIGGNTTGTIDYFDTSNVNSRIARRASLSSRIRKPWTFIEPLDSLIEGPGPGEVALILAPFKRGKSKMLQWLSVAYALQGLSVLLITLENPRTVVEDRLDSICSAVPIKALRDMPRTVAQRLARFKALISKQLHIYDGTQGGVSIPFIEQLLAAKRNEGVLFDSVIIDYDDEIVPTIKHKDRRFEFADIYRDMRQASARWNQIWWTAAQTQRDTEHLKIISGDKAAEDISKIRKVALAISMGQGDWEEGNSIYLWVAAANNDNQHVGCHIIPDNQRMLIYDREATTLMTKRMGENK